MRPPAGRLLEIGGALLYVVLWSSGFIPSRILLRELGPLWAADLRLALAGTLLLGLASALHSPLPIGRDQWRAVIGIGVLTNVLYLALVYAALRHLSSGMAAIIASTNPLLLALFAPRLLGERLTTRAMLGMVMGFLGVAFVMAARAGAPTERPLDAILALVSVLGLVGSTIIYKRASFAMRSLPMVTALQLIVGAVAVLPLALLVEGQPRLPQSPGAWIAMGYLVLIMSVGASLLWFWLLTRGEATRVSAYYFLVPMSGLILSHITLGERLAGRDLVGAAGIAIGIAISHGGIMRSSRLGGRTGASVVDRTK